MLGTNRDDAVKMLERYSESAGKCDNNQRKWCKNNRKMKEAGKTLGNIHGKCMKIRNLEEMVQKPMEKRGENGRKHVKKNAGQNTLKTHEEDVETAGKHDNDQRKSCKIQWKMLETLQ